MAALLALCYEILAAVLEGLGVLSGIASILNFINQQVPSFARERVQYSIAGEVNEINQTVNSLTVGNSALHDQMVADTAAIILAIGNAQQAANPVILPAIPPAGYGTPTSSDIGSAVWNWPGSAYNGLPADQLGLSSLYAENQALIYKTVPIQSGEFFTESGPWRDTSAPSGTAAQPTWPIANIISSDTLSTFIERESGYNGWALAGDGSYYSVADGVAGFQYQTVMSPQAFLLYKESLFPVATGVVAPVWPGLAKVTFGTSVALASVVTLTEVMDGVVITLTGTPPDKPKYVLGGLTATAHIGQLAFVDDDGHAEYPQNLSFASQVYVPIAMAAASACVVRAVPGVTGTIQAWKVT